MNPTGAETSWFTLNKSKARHKVPSTDSCCLLFVQYYIHQQPSCGAAEEHNHCSPVEHQLLEASSSAQSQMLSLTTSAASPRAAAKQDKSYLKVVGNKT
jgi:hypothetical protein